MSLQAKLDAFKDDFEAGKPPYNVTPSVVETKHRATAELIASGAANRALKIVDKVPAGSPSSSVFSGRNAPPSEASNYVWCVTDQSVTAWCGPQAGPQNWPTKLPAKRSDILGNLPPTRYDLCRNI